MILTSTALHPLLFSPSLPLMPVNMSEKNRDDIPNTRKLSRSTPRLEDSRALNKKRNKSETNTSILQLWCKPTCLIAIMCLYTIQRKQQGCLSTISENQTMLECVSFHTVEPAINPWPLFRLHWAEGWPQLWNNKGPVMVSPEACCLNFVSLECVRRGEEGRKKAQVINFSCSLTDCANWWQ